MVINTKGSVERGHVIGVELVGHEYEERSIASIV